TGTGERQIRPRLTVATPPTPWPRERPLGAPFENEWAPASREPISMRPDTLVGMQSEWRWFFASIRDSILHPRAFASQLAREHFGLAGVFVVIAAGISLSVSIDAIVILSKGADPLADLTRLVIDAF